MLITEERKAQALNDAINKYAQAYNNLEFKLMAATIHAEYGWTAKGDDVITLALDSAEFVCGVSIRKRQYRKLIRQMKNASKDDAVYLQIRNFLRLFGWEIYKADDYLK